MTTTIPTVAAPARTAPRQRRRLRRPGPLTYGLLVAMVAGSMFPLYWSLVVASRTNAAASQTPPPFLPGGHLWENISRVFTESEFQKALVNSVVVSGTITVSVVFFATLAGFAFAKLQFRGRNVLLLGILATMMVPTQLGIIPLYILMGELGWASQIQAVIVPGLVTAFGVFFMRQYISGALPTELLEAGRVDGCNTVRLYWHIALPAARPAAAVLGMFTFMQAWNDYLWPLVVLTPENPTVQVAMSTLATGRFQDRSLVLAGTLVGTVPLIVVFLLLGKQIVGGIMQGAVRA